MRVRMSHYKLRHKLTDRNNGVSSRYCENSGVSNRVACKWASSAFAFCDEQHNCLVKNLKFRPIHKKAYSLTYQVSRAVLL